MPHPNPLLDRTGHAQSYTQRIAANLNWQKRMTLGFISMGHVHKNLLWIHRHPEYETSLTLERKEQLRRLNEATKIAEQAAKDVVTLIEDYYKLPVVPKIKNKTGT